MIASLALMLGACAASIESVNPKPIELAQPQAQPPDVLRKPCRRPNELPDRDLAAGEVERLWSTERAALANCAALHQGALDFYQTRDRKLAGE